MKHALRATLLVSLGLSACRTTSDLQAAQEKTPHIYENPWEDPQYMQLAMEYMAPGEPHQALARAAGSWDVDCKLFMKPDAEAVPMAATADSRMILGGRFLLEEFKGEMMGRPFEGLLILGYNNLDREYFSIWLDTWGTGYSLATGREDAEGRIALSGTMRDALTPRGRPFRHVTVPGDDGTQTVRLIDTLPDGTEWVVMEMDYTRRQ